MAKKTNQTGENSTKPTTTSNTSSDSACSSLISHLMKKGTWGIESLYQVMTNNCENIPNVQGIFIVLTIDRDFPGIITQSQAMKRYIIKDPKTLGKRISKANISWNDNSYILFIGETEGKKLKGRIKKFINFGKGITDDYCGALFVWLLKCLCHVLILWIALPEDCDPKLVQKHLLIDFENYYGTLPYANERRPYKKRNSKQKNNKQQQTITL